MFNNHEQTFNIILDTDKKIIGSKNVKISYIFKVWIKIKIRFVFLIKIFFIFSINCIEKNISQNYN